MPDERIGRMEDRKNAGPGMAEFSFVRSFRRYGGMRYYVLWLLNNSPMKGAEIMDEIQKQTMGWWRPSPGTIYPLLSTLERENLIRRRSDLRYELTPEGRSEVGIDAGQSESNWNVERIVSDLEGYITYLEEETDNALPFLKRIESVQERLDKLLERMHGGK